MEDSTSGDGQRPPETGGVAAGTILKDRYRVERELGRGGIGVVFLARDQLLHDKPVVVKLLLGTVGDTAWVLRKFQHEIAALARIDHPGVVGALDVGELDNRTPYIVMQFVEGRSLRAVAVDGALAFDRIGRLMRMIGQALSAAHERGVVHRDLKPENVMVQQAGPGEEYARLIDFGIASVLEPDRTSSQQTSTMVAGTVYYMAPEQLEGKPTRASDVFAMGVMAYELVTGRVPFLPETPFQLLELQRHGPERRPSEINRAVPAAADAAIMKALAFNAADRFASAREFGEALERALAEPAGAAASSASSIPAGATAAFHDAGATEAEIPARDTQPADPATVRADSGDARVYRDEPTRVEPASGQRSLLIMIGGAVLVAAVAVGAWKYLGPGPAPQPPANNANVGPIEVPAPTPRLSYAVLVQRYRDGKPYDEPFVLPGESYFEADDRIRLVVSAPGAGHLYVLNEETAATGGASNFNTLFPSPTANGGKSLVPAGGTVNIPDGGWFKFDAARTVEKLWLVWSAEPIPELEALERLANPTDKGAIPTGSEAAWVARFLADTAAASRATVTRDAENRRSTLASTGTTLVHAVLLEHR